MHQNGNEIIDQKILDDYEEKFHSAINDDLNMPLAMGIVWDLVKEVKKSKQIAKLLLKFDNVLALDLINSSKYLKNDSDVSEEIKKLIEERKIAKENIIRIINEMKNGRKYQSIKIENTYANKDVDISKISEKGYTIKDTPEGTIVEKTK